MTRFLIILFEPSPVGGDVPFELIDAVLQFARCSTGEAGGDELQVRLAVLNLRRKAGSFYPGEAGRRGCRPRGRCRWDTSGVRHRATPIPCPRSPTVGTCDFSWTCRMPGA